MNTGPKISRAQFGVKTDFAAIQFHKKKVGKVERTLPRWKDTALGRCAECEENPHVESPKFGGSGKFDDRGLESTIRSRIRFGLFSTIRFRSGTFR